LRWHNDRHRLMFFASSPSRAEASTASPPTPRSTAPVKCKAFASRRAPVCSNRRQHLVLPRATPPDANPLMFAQNRRNLSPTPPCCCLPCCCFPCCCAAACPAAASPAAACFSLSLSPPPYAPLPPPPHPFMYTADPDAIKHRRY
jgi:hypothetical protein